MSKEDKKDDGIEITNDGQSLTVRVCGAAYAGLAGLAEEMGVVDVRLSAWMALVAIVSVLGGQLSEEYERAGGAEPASGPRRPYKRAGGAEGGKSPGRVPGCDLREAGRAGGVLRRAGSAGADRGDGAGVRPYGRGRRLGHTGGVGG